MKAESIGFLNKPWVEIHDLRTLREITQRKDFNIDDESFDTKSKFTIFRQQAKKQNIFAVLLFGVLSLFGFLSLLCTPFTHAPFQVPLMGAIILCWSIYRWRSYYAYCKSVVDIVVFSNGFVYIDEYYDFTLKWYFEEVLAIEDTYTEVLRNHRHHHTRLKVSIFYADKVCIWVEEFMGPLLYIYKTIFDNWNNYFTPKAVNALNEWRVVEFPEFDVEGKPKRMTFSKDKIAVDGYELPIEYIRFNPDCNSGDEDYRENYRVEFTDSRTEEYVTICIGKMPNRVTVLYLLENYYGLTVPKP